MSDQRFLTGWSEVRIRQILAHYDDRSEDEQADEIETVHQAEGVTVIAVPTALVPEVRALLAEKSA